MKLLLVGILVFMLVGCAGQFQGIGDIGTLDLKNAEQTRKLAKDLLSTWKLNSGFLKGYLGTKMKELPTSLTEAMTELDTIASKPEDQWTDADLGYSLGVRVRLLSAVVQQAIKQFAPEIMSYIPGWLAL